MMGMSVRFFLLPLVGPSANFLLPLTSENKKYTAQCNLVSKVPNCQIIILYKWLVENKM